MLTYFRGIIYTAIIAVDPDISADKLNDITSAVMHMDPHKAIDNGRVMDNICQPWNCKRDSKS
ncbi:hypothetical protein [Butyrivibrio sp. WCD3002]|uniref:hypothetical protein n=1 Tax=Butyrivibrio sp. WCD3002 TaxID=1280676 RepID=UPI0004283CF9|nr:hypothetical protein [Butyrivibrio sp. WCD3002]